MAIDLTELASYYANLLIIQYLNKPKAWADIYTEIKGLWANDIFSQIRDSFDINTAIGSQLDIIAKYVGASREIPGKVGTIYNLSDADLLTFIKFKIIQNNSNHSNKEIDDLMFQFFGTTIKVIDNKDMTMAYIFSSDKTDLLNSLLASNSLPKPAGVAIILIVLPDFSKSFGFSRYIGTTPSYIYGFSTYGGTPSGASWARYS